MIKRRKGLLEVKLIIRNKIFLLWLSLRKEILHPLKAYQSERGYLDMNRESDYTR